MRLIGPDYVSLLIFLPADNNCSHDRNYDRLSRQKPDWALDCLEGKDSRVAVQQHLRRIVGFQPHKDRVRFDEQLWTHPEASDGAKDAIHM